VSRGNHPRATKGLCSSFLLVDFSFPVENVGLTDLDAVLVKQVGQRESAHAFLAAHSDCLSIRLTALHKGSGAAWHRSVDDLI